MNSISRSLSFCCLFIVLLCFAAACKDSGKRKLIGTYERDKFVPADTSAATAGKIAFTGNWRLVLEDDTHFRFVNSDSGYTGKWEIEKKIGDDYFLSLKTGTFSIPCRLNGLEVHFDKPNKMQDSLFKSVIFIRRDN